MTRSEKGKRKGRRKNGSKGAGIPTKGKKGAEEGKTLREAEKAGLEKK